MALIINRVGSSDRITAFTNGPEFNEYLYPVIVFPPFHCGGLYTTTQLLLDGSIDRMDGESGISKGTVVFTFDDTEFPAIFTACIEIVYGTLFDKSVMR